MVWLALIPSPTEADQARRLGGAQRSLFSGNILALEGDAVPDLPGEVIDLLYPPAVDTEGAVTIVGTTLPGNLSFVMTDGELVWTSIDVTLLSSVASGPNGEWVATASDPSVLKAQSDLDSIVRVGDMVGIYRFVGFDNEREMGPEGVAFINATVELPGGPTFGVILRSSTRLFGDVEFEIHPEDRFGGAQVTALGVSDFDIFDQDKAYSVQLRAPRHGSVVVNRTIVAERTKVIPGGEGIRWWGDFGDVSINRAAVVFVGATDEPDRPNAIGYFRLTNELAATEVFTIGDCLQRTIGPWLSDRQCFDQIDSETELREVALGPMRNGSDDELAYTLVNPFTSGTSPGDEFLFYACDGASPGRAELLLSTVDLVDLDGDGVGDAAVDTIGLPVLDGREVAVSSDQILVGVLLREGGVSKRSILALSRPVCPAS